MMNRGLSWFISQCLLALTISLCVFVSIKIHLSINDVYSWQSISFIYMYAVVHLSLHFCLPLPTETTHLFRLHSRLNPVYLVMKPKLLLLSCLWYPDRSMGPVARESVVSRLEYGASG